MCIIFAMFCEQLFKATMITYVLVCSDEIQKLEYSVILWGLLRTRDLYIENTAGASLQMSNISKFTSHAISEISA